MISCLEKLNLDKKIAYMFDKFGFIGFKETGVIVSVG